MLFRFLFSILKNLRWVITILLLAGGLYLGYTQYQAIKTSPLGALLPSLSLPNLPNIITTGTPTPSPTLPSSLIVAITTPNGDINFTAEVAATDEAKAIGLMYRTSLAQYSGMYFHYEQDVQHGFWMKNVELPLDMIFIGSEGKIIDVRGNVRPCKETDPEQKTCPSYVPNAPYRAVLEINGGSAQKHGIIVGQTIKIK